VPPLPAGVFQGVIDYHDDNPDSRGGFASFRTKPEERVRDLSSFEALEMRIKTDGRPCVIDTANTTTTPHDAAAGLISP